MSARVTFVVAALMLGGSGAAHANCRAAISEFEAIINSDLETGNVAKRVHARVIAELTPVKQQCSAGRDAEATRALAAVRSRHGYR
jgi:carbamate kinase